MTTIAEMRLKPNPLIELQEKRAEFATLRGKKQNASQSNAPLPYQKTNQGLWMKDEWRTKMKAVNEAFDPPERIQWYDGNLWKMFKDAPPQTTLFKWLATTVDENVKDPNAIIEIGKPEVGMLMERADQCFFILTEDKTILVGNNIRNEVRRHPAVYTIHCETSSIPVKFSPKHYRATLPGTILQQLKDNNSMHGITLQYALGKANNEEGTTQDDSRPWNCGITGRPEVLQHAICKMKMSTYVGSGDVHMVTFTVPKGANVCEYAKSLSNDNDIEGVSIDGSKIRVESKTPWSANDLLAVKKSCGFAFVRPANAQTQIEFQNLMKVENELQKITELIEHMKAPEGTPQPQRKSKKAFHERQTLVIKDAEGFPLEEIQRQAAHAVATAVGADVVTDKMLFTTFESTMPLHGLKDTVLNIVFSSTLPQGVRQTVSEEHAAQILAVLAAFHPQLPAMPDSPPPTPPLQQSPPPAQPPDAAQPPLYM